MNVGISACLLSVNCTYKGSHNLIDGLLKLKNDIEWIPICPEVLGGLPTPRDPSEIQQHVPLIVSTVYHKDVTREYIEGPMAALNILNTHNVKVVLLKHRSPSCGSDGIYDGTFSRTVVDGQGVCAKLLNENGMKIFHENEINEFLKYIGKEEDYGTYFKD